MKKRFIAVFLCLCVTVGLLPVTVFAGEDISTKGLDLCAAAPAVKTAYAAGSGTVTWDPTVSPATLTFDGATIDVTTASGVPATAVVLPDLTDGVNVVFKGTNSIKANNTDSATVFECKGKTTFTLEAGSDTVLNAGNKLSSSPTGIHVSSAALTSIEISGSGKLTIDAESSSMIAPSYAINANDTITHQVALAGGTLAFSGSVSGNVTLGGVTVPTGSTLRLEFADSVTRGTAGAVINGKLVFKDDITLVYANTLGLTGTGEVMVGGPLGKHIYVDGEWIRYGGDMSQLYYGIDMSAPDAAPTEKTYTKQAPAQSCGPRR